MRNRQRRGATRTTISLPWELRRKMKCRGGDFNWSAIAAEAFATEIGREHARHEDAGIDEVIERLRGTLPTSRGELFGQGRAEGEKWAREQATVSELQLLYAARRQTRFGHHRRGCRTESWLATIDDQSTPADVLAKIIGREKMPHADGLDKNLLESSEYVHGFAMGAIRLWKQVARRLRSRLR